MAWHYGTYACGHEGRVQVYGPTKQRDRKAEWYFSQKCDECKELDHQAENEESAAKAWDMELPELAGASERQIAYGETCRMKLIMRIEKFIERWEEDMAEFPEDKRSERFADFHRFPWDEVPAIFDHILKIDSAKWWIEQSYTSDVSFLLAKTHVDLLAERRAEEVRVRQEKQKAEESAPKKTPAPPIRPEEPKTETIAEIRIANDALQIRFPEYRDDFREVVKRNLKMKWAGSCWEREIGYRNGSVQDRAAEAGHVLLAEGFIVRIDDEEIREKAISGAYEPEHTRWIVTFSDGSKNAGKLGIIWDRDREDFYSVARRLPGSSWSNPYVIVRPEHFEEILDFSERYDFRVTSSAQKILDDARKEKDRALLVSVPKPEEPERVVADTKPPKLDVPDEVGIDESLRDDD